MATSNRIRHYIQQAGLTFFIAALLIFTLLPALETHRFDPALESIHSGYHIEAIRAAATAEGLHGSSFNGSILYVRKVGKVLSAAQVLLDEKAKAGLPEGVSEWDYRIGDWKISDYKSAIIKESAVGMIARHKAWWLLMTFGLGIVGGLMFILPKFMLPPGIKHDRIYNQSLTKGLSWTPRAILLGATISGVLLYGYFYMNGQWFWPLVTVALAGLITFLTLKRAQPTDKYPARSASSLVSGRLGILAGVYLISFYILLYWKPEYLTSQIMIADPISKLLNGGPASRWFLYGLLYTVIVIVMGIRMWSKYQRNTYQKIRTASVVFFQTAFAFLIPEVMVRLNQPYFDFKNIWPLNYTFFFDWNLRSLLDNGGLGIFMLVWGIALIIIAVPVLTYFFGKRWYCSWVCGCGGLAETMGDPFRQLSDKSLRAWRYERYIIHGVLVFAVVMTALVLFQFFTGRDHVGFLSAGATRQWYGFLIGSAFAGVVGTGFYPLMGNRVWCRFGCPLAAYLGLVQRFKSRFRITTNGGQCISCGNCSTYCEMGIDVRWYAQRGQDIVRSSCVGCGVCSAVCPRGVLRLENASSDTGQRAQLQRTIHIGEHEVGLL